MLKSKSLIKLISLILLLSLYAFSSFTNSFKSREKIKGKWYHNHGGNYYKTTDRSSIARWYEFKNNSKVSFSTCTDWCGCMRVTYKGKYDWINDSTISVEFNESNRKVNETLKVIRENKNKLRIEKIRDK